LENHLSQGGPYDVYLGSHQICSAVNTSVQHNGDFNCFIDGNIIPPGVYDLFSTRYNQYPNRLATAPQPVIVGNATHPPANVTVDGPTTGNTNTIYTFTATITPITTTQPLTYLWQASGQAPLTHTDGLSDMVGFAWGAGGPQVITTTVTNVGGTVTDSHYITLSICEDPLQNKSFETLDAWVLAGSEFVINGPGGHTGNRQLLAHSFNGNYRRPYFYQQFTLPGLVISSTTHLKLSLFKSINNLGDGDDPNDRFYAILATGPSLSSTHVTNPVEIANGVVGSLPNSLTGWQPVNVLLLPASGINLADYIGQNLYLYIYNNSNVNCTPPSTNCHASEFYFDDVDLDVCSTDLPALTLPQLDLPASVAPSGTLTYTIAVVNPGSADATNVVMTDTLDNNVNFASASDGGQHNADVVTWNVGTLPLGRTITRTLQVTVNNVPDGTILTNTVQVTSTEGISYTIINTTTVSNSSSPPPRPIYLPIILK
jgi:uncharacterized repeat protein (TIGR01451 family)